LQELNENPKITPLLTTVTAIESLVLFVAGVGLLIAPESFSSFWPWSIDEFHGRMYSVLYITPALGALLLFGAASSIELLAAGLTQVVGGIVPILGVVIIDNQVDKIEWSTVGPWLWIGSFAIILLTGIGLLWMSREKSRLEVPPGMAVPAPA